MQSGNEIWSIEYNLKNIFLKNHTQSVVEKLLPDPFLENENWASSWGLVIANKLQTTCF